MESQSQISSQFSLSLELTTLFGPAMIRAGHGAVSAIIDWARKLRHGGSDAVVELDLAEVFGRGKIEPALEADFRRAVIQPFNITPLRNGKLELSKGAGPTLTWRDNPFYQYLLSSIVQLSFLGSIYDRTALATTLTECLETRFEKGWSPLQSPGFDGIYRTLETCSSETSAFNWSQYLDQASMKLSPLIPLGNLLYRGDSVRLPPHVLLGCLDFLYIVQRTPEERLMRVNGPDGVLALIVWAHYILGLSVLVRKGQASGQVEFKKDADRYPVIIVDLAGPAKIGTTTKYLNNLCLLSKDDELLFSTDRDLLTTQRMDVRERLRVRGYGTITLCRLLDEPLDTIFRDLEVPHLVDAAQFVIAMAFLISHRLVRRRQAEGREAEGKPHHHEAITIGDVQRSQILNAASLLFAHPYSTVLADRLAYVKEEADKYFETISQYQTWDKMPLPTRLGGRLRRIVDAGVEDLCELATTLICLSMTKNLHQCAELKLVVAGPTTDYRSFFKKVNNMNGKIELEPHDIFSHMCRLLIGSDLSLRWEDEDGDVFMVSDFGWTISLPVYGDLDPSDVDPKCIYAYEGTPTNSKTLERKTRIRDGPGPALELTPAGGPFFNPDIDHGPAQYKPRCVSPVQERTEYIGSLSNGFHVSVKVTGVHLEHFDENGDQPLFWSVHRYRGLHEARWRAYLASRCKHGRDVGEGVGEAKLSMGVAAAAGIWAWRPGGWQENNPLPESLVVVLVKGDKRARWLAVAAALTRAHGRQVMIRGSSSCENCAVQEAAKLSGRWAIVI